MTFPKSPRAVKISISAPYILLDTKNVKCDAHYRIQLTVHVAFEEEMRDKADFSSCIFIMLSQCYIESCYNSGHIASEDKLFFSFIKTLLRLNSERLGLKKKMDINVSERISIIKYIPMSGTVGLVYLKSPKFPISLAFSKIKMKYCWKKVFHEVKLSSN